VSASNPAGDSILTLPDTRHTRYKPSSRLSAASRYLTGQRMSDGLISVKTPPPSLGRGITALAR
jgi:hypothetical protein